MYYRSQAVNNNQSQRATMAKKSQLLGQIEDLQFQHEQHHNHIQPSLQMKHGTVACTFQSRAKLENVPLLQPKFASKPVGARASNRMRMQKRQTQKRKAYKQYRGLRLPKQQNMPTLHVSIAVQTPPPAPSKRIVRGRQSLVPPKRVAGGSSADRLAKSNCRPNTQGGSRDDGIPNT